jgi:S-adenosylmethionine synthetase
MNLDNIIEGVRENTAMLLKVHAATTASPVQDIEDILPSKLESVKELEELSKRVQESREFRKKLVSIAHF